LLAVKNVPQPPPPPPPCLLSGKNRATPPPPPPPLTSKGPALSTRNKVDIPKALQPKAMPKGGSKLKQIQWTKIPVEKVIGDGVQKIRNVWMSSAKLPENGTSFVI
uniref:FH2 domain-containing protein n=1 Tax=Gongylonema pulchrum TaxID=637853 RepID=A0A183D6A6_9BILA